jgi:hypothetical protein
VIGILQIYNRIIEYFILLVFKNGVHRNIVEPEREELGECWTKLRNEMLHVSRSSTDSIQTTRHRSMGWEERVVCMRRREMRTGFWLRNLKKRPNLEDLVINGKIILKWI